MTKNTYWNEGETTSERIDHAKEALALRSYASQQPEDADCADVLAAAQVHATLALVEQQRIANIIALHRHEVEYDLNEGRSLIFESGSETLRSEISEALGID